jgi:Tfp pilus assembly PilM family ATPase
VIRSRGYSPIGVHFDHRSFRAVQLVRQQGRWAMTAAVRVHRTGQDDIPTVSELKTLRGILDRQGFVGTGLVLAVPTSQMYVGVVEVPPRSSGAPIGDIAQAELARINGCEAGDLESAHWELPPVFGGQTATQALALGCAHTVADGLLDAFDQAGLDVIALDGEAPAAIRACKQRASGTGMTGILDIGWQDTQLNLLLGGQVLYHRTIAGAGIGAIAEQLAQTLGVDDVIVDRLLTTSASSPNGSTHGVHEAAQEALEAHWRLIADETQAPLSYVAHQYMDADVQELFLTGYTSLDDHAAEFFAAKLDRPVQTVRPGDLASCGSDMADKAADSSLTTAVGLAEFLLEPTS